VPTVLLPWTAERLPDEILGSWLGAISSLVGIGAWRPFYMSHGYGRKGPHSSFLSAPRSPRVGALLEDLGVSFKAAVHEMTLLPYWLRFKDPRTCPATGFTAGNAFIRRTRHFSPRFCPACIISDEKEHGRAYCHRSHQLPNVYACPWHRLLLIDRCAICGKPLWAPIVGISAPMSRLCECGADATLQQKPVHAEEWYWNLIDLSAEALSFDEESNGIPDAFEYLRHLRTAGGPDCFHSKLCNAKTSAGSGFPPLEICAQAYPTTREFCLYFALRGMKLAAALAEVRTAVKHEVQKQSIAPVSVSDVKRRFKTRVLQYPTQRTKSVADYWALRLLAPSWLERNHLRGANQGPIPSIAADRGKLRQKFSSRTSYTQTPAYARAKIRDRRWLQTQIGELHDSVRLERRAQTLAARSACLLSAVRSLEGSQPCKRVSHASLGLCCGLSAAQVSRTIASNPVLRAELVRVNKQKPVRVLKQTALQMLASGIPLCTQEWARRAKLPTSSEVVKAMRRIRLDLGQ